MYLWNMNIEKDYIKLIFWLKPVWIWNIYPHLVWTKSPIPLKSYLNEIEKEKVSQNR
jgi:hypothetical protein